jgi:hypothetical protein
MPEPEADQDVKPERQQNGRSQAGGFGAFRRTTIRYNLPKFRIATIMS